jgi:hypothetical protein
MIPVDDRLLVARHGFACVMNPGSIIRQRVAHTTPG